MKEVVEELPLADLSEREPFLAMASEEEKDIDVGTATDEGAPQRILHHKIDADEALKAFAGHEGEHIELDEATNRRLLRKIDLNLMPVSRSVAALLTQK
jgi:MFS transporter, ACS family, allantoate permease